MSDLTLKVAVRYVAAQDEVLEEARGIIERALKEIAEAQKNLKAWLDYAEPAYNLLEINDPKATLDEFFQYRRTLEIASKNLKRLERERDLSRILRVFNDEGGALWVWVDEGFSNIDRLLEYFWNSRVGDKLSDKVSLVYDSAQEMINFHEEHR